jgi:signal transduction histidine kinase
MWHSLAFRLFICFSVVTLATIGIVALVTHQVTRDHFNSYVAEADEQQMQRTRDALQVQYAVVGDWPGAQRVLSAMGAMRGDRLVVTDGEGNVLADSRQELTGSTLDEDALGPSLPLVYADRPVGMLHILRDGRRPMKMQPALAPAAIEDQFATSSNDSSEHDFLGSVRRSLLWAALGAGGIAVVLSLVLSRQLTAPLRSLRNAAHRIADGDLSQRVGVKGDDDVAELSASFNLMAASLDRNERLRRELTADIAHELRTPLSVIQGTLEAILDGVAQPDAQTIASIHQETLLLNRLVTDLRDLSLAEAGQLKLQHEPTDLAELLRQTAARWYAEAEEKGVALEVQAAEMPPASVDADRVAQVVANLLSNALRHTPSGGTIVLSLAPSTIEAQGKAAPAALLSVSDTGCGINAEDLPRVFDRFYRVDRSRSRTSGGSGIGLAIVKYLVEAHGGRAWAQSELNNGSTFLCLLPLEEPGKAAKG